jgi:hypothetical protein
MSVGPARPFVLTSSPNTGIIFAALGLIVTTAGA